VGQTLLLCLASILKTNASTMKDITTSKITIDMILKLRK
jgi:hypothetical protein